MNKTFLKTNELQGMRFLQVTKYQSKYALTNEEMAERISISKERYEELLEDCISITPDEIMKISLALNLNPATFLVNLTLDNYNLNINLFNDIDRLSKKLSSKELAQIISFLINNNRLVILNEKLYWVSNAHRVRDEICLEDRKKLTEICLKEHFIDAARFLSYKENILNISSLKDLDFLSKQEKEIYLYGETYQTTYPYLNVPSYFDNIAETVSKEEKLEMYKTVKEKYTQTLNLFNNQTKESNIIFDEYLISHVEEEVKRIDCKIKDLI